MAYYTATQWQHMINEVERKLKLKREITVLDAAMLAKLRTYGPVKVGPGALAVAVRNCMAGLAGRRAQP